MSKRRRLTAICTFCDRRPSAQGDNICKPCLLECPAEPLGTGQPARKCRTCAQQCPAERYLQCFDCLPELAPESDFDGCDDIDQAMAELAAETARSRRKEGVEKLCRDCKVTKPAADFHPSANSKDGLFTYCKACLAERSRKYRERKRKETTECLTPTMSGSEAQASGLATASPQLSSSAPAAATTSASAETLLSA